jgi:hypothetical protein
MTGNWEIAKDRKRREVKVFGKEIKRREYETTFPRR